MEGGMSSASSKLVGHNGIGAPVRIRDVVAAGFMADFGMPVRSLHPGLQPGLVGES